MAKSIKHRDKLRKLAAPGTDNIDTIGPVRVCCNPEFCIGTGAGGTAVFVGLHEDGSEVAVKRVIINKKEQLNININEKEILLHVKASKHIVNYRHFGYKHPFFYLIVDLCEETLENYVQTHNEEHLKCHGPAIIREMLTGLSTLHGQEKKILHLDLKPQNILVDSEGHMCLADFGISRILNEEETTLRTGQMGTRGWMAAESMSEDGSRARFKRKSDIQVAGMISFYVLMKGKHPFGDDIHYRVTNIIEGNSVNLEQLSDSLARDFVGSMIRHNIGDRPYAEEALKHPFLQIKPGHAGDPELHISTKFDIGKQVRPHLQKTKSLLGTPQRVISRLEEERKMKSRSSGVHISGFFVSDVPAFQKTLEKPVEDIVNHGLVSNSGDFIISNSSTPSPSPSQSMVSSASQIDKHNGNRMTAREIYEGQRDENDRPAGSSIAQTQHYPEQGAKSCTATLRILETVASDKTSRNSLRNVSAIQKKLEERKSVNEIKKEDPIGGQDQGSVSSSSQVNEHNGKPITAREVYEGQRDLSIISIAQTQQPVSNSGDFINPNSSTSSQSPSNSAGQQPATPGFLSSSNGERILEEVLKEIYPMVQSPQKIDVQRTLTTGYIQVKFEINEAKFEVQFPKTFPDVPAKIFATLPKQQYQSDLKPSKNEEFNTSKSILNALRNFLIMKFSEELCIKINDTFSSVGAVNVQIKNDKQGKRVVEHKFEHYQKTYLITIPVEFPEKSARIYYSRYSIGKMTGLVSKSGRPVNNLSEILNAVKCECTCTKCFSTRRNK